MSNGIVSAVMKFFGHLSITDAQCLRRYPNFLRNLLDLVYQYDRLDASLRLLAFDTLAVVASTEDAKRYLSSFSGKLRNIIVKVS